MTTSMKYTAKDIKIQAKKEAEFHTQMDLVGFAIVDNTIYCRTTERYNEMVEKMGDVFTIVKWGVEEVCEEVAKEQPAKDLKIKKSVKNNIIKDGKFTDYKNKIHYYADKDMFHPNQFIGFECIFIDLEKERKEYKEIEDSIYHKELEINAKEKANNTIERLKVKDGEHVNEQSNYYHVSFSDGTFESIVAPNINAARLIAIKDFPLHIKVKRAYQGGYRGSYM